MFYLLSQLIRFYKRSKWIFRSDFGNSVVKARYFDSQFIHRAHQYNLHQSITKSNEGLPKTNMNQLSMDGPMTNWAVFEKFNALREENDEPKFAEIGSCSLHIVPEPLNAGVNASDWKVLEVMKVMWKILSDSPARIDIHAKSRVSGKLAQRFCGPRLFENEDAGEKAILVWPDIVVLIKHFLPLCLSKRPKNKKSLGKLAQSAVIELMIIKSF